MSPTFVCLDIVHFVKRSSLIMTIKDILFYTNYVMHFMVERVRQNITENYIVGGEGARSVLHNNC